MFKILKERRGNEIRVGGFRKEWVEILGIRNIVIIIKIWYMGI